MPDVLCEAEGLWVGAEVVGGGVPEKRLRIDRAGQMHVQIAALGHLHQKSLEVQRIRLRRFGAVECFYGALLCGVGRCFCGRRGLREAMRRSPGRADEERAASALAARRSMTGMSERRTARQMRIMQGSSRSADWSQTDSISCRGFG